MHQRVALILLITSITIPALGQTTIQARKAGDFVDSLGVNVHLEYANTPYQYYGAINQRLVELGMHHVRDEINDTANASFVAELQQLKSMGYTLCGLIEGGNDYPPAGQALDANAVVPMIQNLLPSIDAVEGPNEPDDQSTPPFAYGVDYLLFPWGAINESENLWSIVKGDPVISHLPLLSMSEGTPQDFVKLAAFTPPPIDYADFGNLHAYQSGFKGDWGLTSLYMHFARKLTGNKPLWTTEMGYHNNTYYLTDGEQQGVSERASAIYLPIAFLSGFNQGVLRTFSYELIDETQGPPLASCDAQDEAQCSGEGYYGLLHYDGTPKPAYTALKNLIALLRDPGNADFQPAPLNIIFTGAPPELRYTLLENSDGDYYLAIWNNRLVYQPATSTAAGYDIEPQKAPFALTFSSPQNFTVYAPNDPSGTNATQLYTLSVTSNTIELNVPAKVLILKVSSN